MALNIASIFLNLNAKSKLDNIRGMYKDLLIEYRAKLKMTSDLIDL